MRSFNNVRTGYADCVNTPLQDSTYAVLADCKYICVCFGTKQKNNQRKISRKWHHAAAFSSSYAAEAGKSEASRRAASAR